MVNGKRKELSIGSEKKMSRTEAIAKFEEIIGLHFDDLEEARNFYQCDGDDPHWAERVSGFQARDNNWLYALYRKAEARAHAKDLEFSLTFPELKTIAAATQGRCKVTDIVFSRKNEAGSRVAPFVPSIDRIDSNLGYKKENCRLICAAANLALMDFGDVVFRQIAFGYVAKMIATGKICAE